MQSPRNLGHKFVTVQSDNKPTKKRHVRKYTTSSPDLNPIKNLQLDLTEVVELLAT